MDKKPNIVFILADDMGWSDLGCYGGEISTPNLDRLGENGIRFTQVYNTSKCFPSRACLLTGLYAQQVGGGMKPFKNSVTLGEVLRNAGYRTYASGKHHNKENLFNRGFDRYYGLRDGCCNYFNPGKAREDEGVPAQKRPGRRVWCIDKKTLQPYTPKEKDFYTTDYFGKYAVKYLDEYQKLHSDKPFFLYLPFTAPHDPLQAWQEDIEKYRHKYTVGYERIRTARYEHLREIGLIDGRWPLSKPTFESWNSLSKEQQKEEALKMAVYAAMIDRMDQNIGKVLNKIYKMGEDENTLILFASDNGCSAEVVNLKDDYGPIGSMTRWTSLGRNWANVSNTPYRYYKNYSFEGGICTPLIAYWPEGINNPGRVSHHVCHFIDFMATFIELADADYPRQHRGERVVPCEGKSLKPIFDGKDQFERGPLFFQWRKGQAVRTEKWKIVVEGQDDWELYDMEKDKTETNNIAEQHSEVVKHLNTKYRNWWKRCQNQK